MTGLLSKPCIQKLYDKIIGIKIYRMLLTLCVAISILLIIPIVLVTSPILVAWDLAKNVINKKTAIKEQNSDGFKSFWDNFNDKQDGWNKMGKD